MNNSQINHAKNILQEIKELDDTIYSYNRAYMSSLDIAIECMDQLQQYMELGTVEELTELKNDMSFIADTLRDYIDEMKVVQDKHSKLKSNECEKTKLNNDDSYCRCQIYCSTCGTCIGYIDEKLPECCPGCGHGFK